MRLGAARLDWLQLRLMCSIMLMRLQELCKSCRISVILLNFIVILFYFILPQSGKILVQVL